MADNKRLVDYATAVRLADNALAEILDQVKRLGGAGDDFTVYGFEERNAVGTAFGSWLTAHPDVDAALEREVFDGFDPFIFESYLEVHASAFDAKMIDDHSGAGDGMLLRIRRAG